MNKVLLIAMILSFAACGTSQNESESASKATSATPTAKAIPENKVDMSEVMKNPQRRPVRRSTARPKDQMVQEFPYDIDLKTAEGKVLKSNDVFNSDKPTVLMFWLTTCMPCRYEMKAIKEKFPQWKEEADFNMYAISTDFERNYEAFVKMTTENAWEWETYNDVNREFRNVMPGELNGLPQTFVLDKDGKIVYHKRKWKPGDEDVMFDKVKSLSKG